MCCIDDRKAFDAAAKGDPEAPNTIATMMRLSCEAVDSRLRRWAGEWLFRHCNVRVVDDEGELSRAAPTQAASFC